MHHVLLVEDDLDTREAMALVLELEGFRVTSAADGREALELMQAAGAPCALVADRRMPRLGGIELAQLLAADPSLAGTACVVVSGDPEPAPDRWPGVCAWLQKPFEADALVALLRRLCDAPHACRDAAETRRGA